MRRRRGDQERCQGRRMHAFNGLFGPSICTTRGYGGAVHMYKLADSSMQQARPGDQDPCAFTAVMTRDSDSDTSSAIARVLALHVSFVCACFARACAYLALVCAFVSLFVLADNRCVRARALCLRGPFVRACPAFTCACLSCAWACALSCT